MARHAVGSVGEIAPGERKIVEVEGRSIGVFNVRGTYVAVLNVCPHALAPVCPHCKCRIVGHGVEADGQIYCCVHCARTAGKTTLKDRV